MKKIIQFLKRHSRRISRIAFVSFFIICIAIFMQREERVDIVFQKGAPWKQKALIAEFDLDVPKPLETILLESDRIRKETAPHFAYNTALADSMCGRLEAILKMRIFFNAHENTMKNYVAHLQDLYNKGIVSDDDARLINNSNSTYIKCLANGKLEKRNSSEMVSCTDAKNILAAQFGTWIDKKELDVIVKPNYTYDYESTELEIGEKIDKNGHTLANLQEGERIISYGDVVDDTKSHIISAYLKEVKKRESENSVATRMLGFIGQAMFVIVAMFLLLFYLELYQPDVAENINKFIFSILTASAFPILIGIIQLCGYSNIYVLPFAIIPMMQCLFVNNSTAFVIHTISILICSTMVGPQYEFILLQLTAGYSVILSLKELSSRSQMFRCVLIAFATYAIVHLCYSLTTTSNDSDDRYAMYIFLGISSLLTLVAYPMMIVFEKTFGFISNVTLIELSNLNTPLLQKLSQEAPGTFQHSIQVSNLAAEAARAIGANSLLVRTGALYHDIGKIENPIYFTENQSNNINPHSNLPYIESAQIIKRHVTDGLERAKRAHLPRSIQEFITTHHGLSKTGWFYVSYKNEHPGEEIDESIFTYPGPKPTTREQAVLMLADCTEAASHSIGTYTEENINKRVDEVVDGKLNNRELDLSPLTFQDIDIIKEVFKKRLMAIYHTRISYPKENKPETPVAETAATTVPTAATADEKTDHSTTAESEQEQPE